MLFGIPPSEMFPHVCTLVEEETMRKVDRLQMALGNNNTLAALRKRELLSLAKKRAVISDNNLEGV
jgi:hypothetical protein